ncbi:MerR family transcriptional regulator [Corynebacterium pseudodiphtheriticum]|uniref:MerR family transcriptional regulator n=1 Tax=Corynebacterium pseudodiphtheriticum TaxID=37637 RepID=A0ABT7FWZ5_9CORY|nr:MerR family transcriptional regulator [Corynebacterium pseudodiphtheriticum]MDK4243279.1 MerR family transcriptional regulator [Corynebacterium pseudodiphtheriticum]MDK4286643.1 MerR family transcriptional regulator [Corynebacterium pseudodiphtheriticum]MDK4290507.1 MerR family transcriptional regulator [Corynebacterium pseudodiphtheriticum]MDK4305762.1 MerR family transcriptional regulator [Corynebacterium pseudodiphtheriticum]MDK4316050.1 MerR family transcriptional regulator [Corynebacte
MTINSSRSQYTDAPYVQESLFDLGPDEQLGYRVPIACQVAGITYRQLDYWARTNLVKPSIRNARGSGSQRLYSFKDVLVLKIVKRLLDTGISLQNIRLAVESLRERGVNDIAEITLVSDGTTVYECHSNEQVIDLLSGGQGVFGVAIPGIMKELSGTISSFPAERIDPALVDDSKAASGIDELAALRVRKSHSA